MICDEHKGALSGREHNVLKTINGHEVVGHNLNPARAYVALTPCPEAFPAPLIHLVRLKESKTLEARKDGEFFRSWVFGLWSLVFEPWILCCGQGLSFILDSLIFVDRYLFRFHLRPH